MMLLPPPKEVARHGQHRKTGAHQLPAVGDPGNYVHVSRMKQKQKCRCGRCDNLAADDKRQKVNRGDDETMPKQIRHAKSPRGFSVCDGNIGGVAEQSGRLVAALITSREYLFEVFA